MFTDPELEKYIISSIPLLLIAIASFILVEVDKRHMNKKFKEHKEDFAEPNA